MFETIAAIAAAIGKIFGFGEKLIPSDKIREATAERHKPRLEQAELIKIYDKQYRRLVNHPEIDIATDCKFVCDNMDDEQCAEMIENLTNRIFKYRARHKIIFRKFLKTDVYKNWAKQKEITKFDNNLN